MKRALILAAFVATECFAQDGLPEPDRERAFRINICYTDQQDVERCELSELPELIRDFGEVGYLSTSPLENGRSIENLPNYPIARYHWWLLGFDVLPRLQRKIADTVGQIRVYQTLLGIYPRIDDPDSPRLPLVNALREYLVPMDALQNASNPARQPRLEDAITHSRAAIYSINERVYWLGLLKDEALRLYAQVVTELQQGREALLKKPKKRRAKK